MIKLAKTITTNVSQCPELVKEIAMEGDSERFVYPREYETLQLIQSLLRELQNDK